MPLLLFAKKGFILFNEDFDRIRLSRCRQDYIYKRTNKENRHNASCSGK